MVFIISNVYYHENFTEIWLFVDLHSRISDGLHFGPLGMFAQLKRFAVSNSFDIHSLLTTIIDTVWLFSPLKLRDFNLERDKVGVGGKREQPLVQEVEQRWLEVVTAGLDGLRLALLHGVEIGHVAKHCLGHLLKGLF